MMNADFPVTSVADKAAEIDARFNPLKEDFKEVSSLEGASHFYEVLGVLKTSMAEFKARCVIDASFYR